jgi:hypothetical protein
MVEYWNVGLNKELMHFIASLSTGILPITQYPIFPEPIIPSFHYSNIPIARPGGLSALSSRPKGSRQVGAKPLSSKLSNKEMGRDVFL